MRPQRKLSTTGVGHWDSRCNWGNCQQISNYFKIKGWEREQALPSQKAVFSPGYTGSRRCPPPLSPVSLQAQHCPLAPLADWGGTQAARAVLLESEAMRSLRHLKQQRIPIYSTLYLMTSMERAGQRRSGPRLLCRQRAPERRQLWAGVGAARWQLCGAIGGPARKMPSTGCQGHAQGDPAPGARLLCALALQQAQSHCARMSLA